MTKSKKAPKSPKKTGVQISVGRYRELITKGQLLAIDPSSGSEGSMPGFAIFKEGRLISCGTIKLPAGGELHLRLQELARTLREEFEVPDVLVVEQIAPYIKGFFNLSLHKSIGATVSAIPCKSLVEISPSSWHAAIRKMGIEDSYVKSDVNDAIFMGYCVVKEAFMQLDLEMPEFDISIVQRENK